MTDISVIIPIYNVSDTIERCARSLFQQTKKEIEYIFVNDCTPDNSMEILKSIIEKDFEYLIPRIQIINLTKNSGQGTARRVGQEYANGKYITFCDSDDWVEYDCYEKLYAATNNDAIDIVICDWFEEYKTKSIIHHEKLISSEPRTALRDSYKCYFKQYLWNKIIKKEVLDKYSIQLEKDIDFWEDELFLNKVFLKSKVLVQIPYPLYHYNKANIKSTTKTVKDKYIHQLYSVTADLLSLYEKESDFEKTSDFLKFRCRNILLRDNWSDYYLFLKTYPDGGKYIKEYDLCGFSFIGRIRIYLIRCGLIRFSIFLNKILKLVNS